LKKLLPRVLDAFLASLRADDPEPAGAVRGSPRPADGQNRRVILSTVRGALQ